MSGIKLYEFGPMRETLDQWLDEGEGELTPELEALLAEWNEKADEKIERVALYVRELLSKASAVKEEAQRLAAMQKRHEKAAESLKGYLLRQMETLQKPKVNGLLCTVAIQANSQPSVTCELSAAELGQHYLGCMPDSPIQQFVKEVPVTWTLDRASILDAWKSGEPMPAEIVVEKGSHLRIR